MTQQTEPKPKRRRAIDKGEVLFRLLVQEQEVESKPALVLKLHTFGDELLANIISKMLRTGDLIDCVYAGRARKRNARNRA